MAATRLLAKEESGIRSIFDLSGKKVGVIRRDPLALAATAGLLLAAGGLLATPVYVPALMRVVAAPFTRRSPLARVAVGDATRNPGRVGAAASALLVAVGMIAVVQVAMVGVRASAFAELDRRYPQYGLAGHKGYPTAAHLAALKAHGACEIYRTSFGPVRDIIANPPLWTEDDTP